ncbi:class I SAM-dependent methyltransferase [Paenibacillus xylanexedens]|uniref:class I SAM-dependent methyltransferase n=1 Tax=Paenibacillus xylanexedens TaxID=528191 RepID=UPI0011A6B30B|nr:class I SAM-dependent methyltransferase [Paenibacillus xylanexedens]
MKQTIQYEAFYEQIGAINGWDFSSMQVVSEGVLWDLYTEVIRHIRPSDLLLDIGTGGGEALLSHAEAASLLVGIDLSHGMIQTAQRNLLASGRSNVRFMQMNAEQLQFPDQFFNMIACRHAPFCASEAYRVLADGGMFLTQQVRENDKYNIKEAFGLEATEDLPTSPLAERYVNELHEAGFRDIQLKEYNATEYYARPEDLLFLLTHAPIIPGFGEQVTDVQTLQHLIQQYQCDLGIRTNAARFLITARK